MSGFNRQAHWQQVYTEKGENQVSWFQERPTVSLELIEAVGVKPSSAIIDIGGGASRLVDALVEKGQNAAAAFQSFATIPRSLPRCLRSHSRWSICAATTTKPPGAPFSI